MAEGKKGRKRSGSLFKTLKWILIAVLVLGIAFVFTAKPLFNIDLLEKLNRSKVETGSEAILTRVQDLFQFQTVEYVYKSVFPFDFVPAVYDWRSLLDKEYRGEPLSSQEEEYLAVYRFCEQIGINLNRKKLDFVVITTIVRGGFDLEGTVYENPENAANIEEYLRIDRDENVLYLRLPPPVITDFEIEDPDRTRYPYPDFEISPENWKLLTQFTAGKIRQQVLEDGIIETAKMKGTAFIEALFMESGIEKVVFLDP